MDERQKKLLLLFVLLLTLGAIHAGVYRFSEPFFYNDETRHVMTGVYFRDVLHDLPVWNLREYTINYYLQYPALGLLVWPPFFYILEGLLMSIFGTSINVPQALIGVFVAMACVYLFRLVCRTHDARTAAVTLLIFGLSPLVFELSHYVMLEMPTLALGLAATYHFIRYLDLERRRDIVLAGLFSALTALTRFDAIYLLPLFLSLLIVRQQTKVLIRKEVLTVAAFALLIVLPFYALTASGVGWFHFRQASESLSPNFPGYLSLNRYYFYLSLLPLQFGWFALVPSVIGIIAGVTTARRQTSLIYFALIIATYVTFTPIGETDSRHTIYWIPAFSLFAAVGIAFIARQARSSKFFVPVAACVVCAMAATNLAKPRHYVRGYEDAARFVAERSDTSPFCLFVGRLNGDFIYQLRRHDPARRLWTLRADKLFYSVLVNKEVGFKQFATSDQDILDMIFNYDPEFIIVAEAKQAEQVPAEDQVRQVVVNHPERFNLEETVTLDSNEPDYHGAQIKVFRNIFRNPQPERRINVDLLMLRRSFQTIVP